MLREAMVVFMFNPQGRVLLGLKQVKFCAGRKVGPGGKVEPGETLHDASVRETEEECGLTPELGEPLGAVLCHNGSDGSEMLVHMYRTNTYDGDLHESETLKSLRWHSVSRRKLGQTLGRMMEGDRTWFQHIINNTKFDAEVWYDANWRLIRHRVQAV